MTRNPTPTTVLVTGGCGFVMSNVIKSLLSSDENTNVISLDVSPANTLVERFFELYQGRVACIQADVRDSDCFYSLPTDRPITHVIHAAMIAHHPQWERAHPNKYLDVNIMGTVNTLEWARTQPGLIRFLYVSSGDVYGEPTSETSHEPHLETGTLDQPELYAISKYASEQIVRRYSEVFELDAVSVRFSGVFGPMERPTPGRAIMAMPYHMIRAAVESRPLRITEGTLEAGADFISSEDIASILPRLLLSSNLRHDIYNVAYGTFTRVPELLQAFKTIAPRFEYELVEPSSADVHRDPNRRYARWNAYDIGRLNEEFGWQPRPVVEQLRTYYEWVMEDPDLRCPPLPKESVLSV